MNNVFDVAKYILEKCGSMTTMKLQKIAYYCQAWSLAWDDEPIFDEDFQAWANGPVCTELFKQHRGKYRIQAEDISNTSSEKFPQRFIESMDIVINDYADKSPQWLSDSTHNEAPWRDARKGYAPGEPCNVVIEKEAMRQYYGGLI